MVPGGWSARADGRRCGSLTFLLRGRPAPGVRGVDQELAVADLDPRARVVIHLDGVLLVIEAVADRVAQLLDRLVVDRPALGLGNGLGLLVLDVLLDPIAGVYSRRRPGHRGDVPARATTDLMTQHTAHDRTGNRSEKSMLVARLRGPCHGLIVA